MNTDEMISALVRDAQPVKRLERPSAIFMTWSAIGVCYVAAVILLIGTRGDLAQVWRRPEFLFHTLIVTGLTVVAAAAAVALSIPNRQQRWTLSIPAIALAAWLTCIVVALASANEPYTGDGWKCLRNIVVLSAPLGVVMCWMLGRAAPLRTRAVGWLVALSAAAAGDLATRFICKNDHALHALVWHFLPVLALGCAGVFLGRMLFRWDAAKHR